MKKAAVVGGSGYTGSELARILCRHPQITLEAMTSRQNAGSRIDKVQPFLKGFTDLVFQDKLPESAEFDIVFLATPSGVSMKTTPGLLERGIKVVDLSGDYRLKAPGLYQKWYGGPHTDEPNLDRAAYGMTELFRGDVKGAALVANPGCYPTCSVLSLAPLLANDLVEGKIIVDGKSGTSGAGQELTRETHHPVCGASISPYKIGRHRHTPEIKMAVERMSKAPAYVVFTPHLLPLVRGMLTTSYVTLKKGVGPEEIAKAYERFYAHSPFVHLTTIPSIPDVVGSNSCEIGYELAGNDTVVVMGALDNLVKGAAGQAVQNANVMLGFNETAGLDFPGLGV
jgi:N-acetyl-gamma-glutamyl-phosphate reductase